METPNNLNSSDNLLSVKKNWNVPTVEIISVEGGVASGTEGSGNYIFS